MTERFYRNRLGSILVSAELLSEEDLEQALERQRESGMRLGDILLNSNFVSEDDVVEARSLQLDIPHIHLKNYNVNPEVVKMVPEAVARDYHLVPVSTGRGRVAIAMADPLDVEAIDMVQRITRCKATPLLSSESAINDLIDSAYGTSVLGDLSAMLEEAVDSVTDVEVGKVGNTGDSVDLNETRRQSEQAPIVRTVNHILKEAVTARASDIHIEPRREGCEVRFRIDGALREVRTLPRSIQAAVISRIKIMADMDIAEKRIPQDGRIAVTISKRSIDIRLSSLPTQYGERLVMRLLDKGTNTLALDQLGFSTRDRDLLETLIRRPHGILLVTGPTGSGKTTTLYSCLNEIKSPETNIITVEDPVEYELDGVSQSNVNVKAGLTFANQLRAILRQDPDVILVGEVRDQETADIAFRASMTGHLVFSTLHCNDAAGAFTRLIDMGVEPFLIVSSLSGVLAQRLVRTICTTCRESYSPDPDEVTILDGQGLDTSSVKLYRGRGCKECGGSGYRGRMMVAEILEVSREIRKLALQNTSSEIINMQAIEEGMTSMRHDAFQKVLSGVTTLSEVMSKVVLSEDR